MRRTMLSISSALAISGSVSALWAVMSMAVSLSLRAFGMLFVTVRVFMSSPMTSPLALVAVSQLLDAWMLVASTLPDYPIILIILNAPPLRTSASIFIPPSLGLLPKFSQSCLGLLSFLGFQSCVMIIRLFDDVLQKAGVRLRGVCRGSTNIRSRFGARSRQG
jgi:hypothetical protein